MKIQTALAIPAGYGIWLLPANHASTDAEATDVARPVDVGSLRLIAIMDAVLTLQGHNTASEQDPTTGTRRFTSSEISIPDPRAPLAKDLLGQGPAHGRRKAERLRSQRLHTLFQRRA